MAQSTNRPPTVKWRTVAGLLSPLFAVALMAISPGTAMAAVHDSAAVLSPSTAAVGSSGSKSAQLVASRPAGQRTSASTTQSACPIDRGGHRGYYICGTAYSTIRFPDGRVHTFVIGLDHAVWNIVEYASGGSSGWTSLGGWAQVGVFVRYVNSPSSLGIWVYGRDGNRWCKNLNGGWGGWHRC